MGLEPAGVFWQVVISRLLTRVGILSPKLSSRPLNIWILPFGVLTEREMGRWVFVVGVFLEIVF